ncbi:MAG: right-handed parallel beta-helix repeat-containing protein [Candidatus Peribacteraceae bacterium]|nr:right-handed parallel beta-helix repeat-containing protein [Candidatus Peribacteraceae bacterium]
MEPPSLTTTPLQSEIVTAKPTIKRKAILAVLFICFTTPPLLVFIYFLNITLHEISPNTCCVLSSQESEKAVTLIEEKMEKNTAGQYIASGKESLAELAKQYNADTQALATFNDIRNADTTLTEGTVVLFPIEELRHTLQKNLLMTFPLPTISYDEKNNNIMIGGKGSVATISQLAKALPNPKILENAWKKEWMLRADITVSDGATFIIDGEDTTWLKLKSDRKEFVRIMASDGNILILNTKITSWDEAAQMPDENIDDARSYIRSKGNGRMDVINSEIAYLGFSYALNAAMGQYDDAGYGLSWKNPNGFFNLKLLTGNIINSNIHHNYFGVFTFGTTGMILRGNTVHNNIQYGLDPHDDSNNLLIENNVSQNNGNHGIIISRRCNYNIIRNNTSTDNKLHGIMLDRQSNYNLVENNTVSHSVSGIAIYDSHNNIIQNNKISDNQNGIRANVRSSNNIILGNAITTNQNGIYVYSKAHFNVMEKNTYQENTQNIYLNTVKGNHIGDSIDPQTIRAKNAKLQMIITQEPSAVELIGEANYTANNAAEATPLNR